MDNQAIENLIKLCVELQEEKKLLQKQIDDLYFNLYKVNENYDKNIFKQTGSIKKP